MLVGERLRARFHVASLPGGFGATFVQSTNHFRSLPWGHLGACRGACALGTSALAPSRCPSQTHCIPVGKIGVGRV